MYEQQFKNMRFDFDLSTNKLLLLDTKQNDNQTFYGKAIGKASLSLKGPLENMKMNITGEVNDTTQIFIPTATSRESSEADFIRFKKYGTEIKVEAERPAKLNIDLDLTANNKAQMNVILDPLTGDIIKATGNGRLRIKVPATGAITMNGRYNIEEGKYDFNFQSLVKKPFELLPDVGSFIEWNGDPYNANIHIDAQYVAHNVSLNDLTSNTGINLGSTAQGYRGDVYVIAELRDKLSRPRINFKLDFPQGSPIRSDHDFDMFLTKLENDDNEMLKQVTWLIVFGAFAPYGEFNNGGGNNNYVRAAGLNTISQKLTSEVNKMVSSFLSKVTGDKSLQFDVSSSTYSSSELFNTNASGQSNKLDRTSVQLKVNQSLLNGKVIVTFGGGFDFGLGATAAVQSGNFQWLPDISVQVILSKDRKLRAIAFNKSSLDVNNAAGALGRKTRQGVSLSYSFDFPKQKNDTTELAKPQPAKKEEAAPDPPVNAIPQ
jgi:hypothetical protein